LYLTCAKELGSDWLPLHREARAGDIRDSLADISLAKNLLGYQPTKKFEEGLIETVKYFKAIYT
jgi:nucleoside-diphosphate-sugar epimerase